MKLNNIPLVVLVCASLLLTGVPAAVAIRNAAPVWQGVPPPHIEDALFYYSRIKEVSDGNLFFGNPAYLEHTHEVAGSFSISEWAAAVPLVVTGSWAFTIIWNNIFWPLLTTLLIYFLFRTLGLGRWGSVLGSLLVLLQMLLLFERPVIMQVPYAVFTLITLTMARWLKDGSWLNSLHLAVASALGALVWVFLGGIAALMLGLAFLSFVWVRDWVRVYRLIQVGVISAVLTLPIVALQIFSLIDPSHHDMLLRFGLVVSHIPSTDAWYYGRWLVILCLALVWAPRDYRAHFFILASLALLATFLSPLITGHDVNTGSHAGRFVFPILAAGLVYITHEFIWLGRWREPKRWQCALVAVLCLVSLLGIGINVLKRNVPHVPSQNDIAVAQAYAAPLRFIDERESESVVIWANADISEYIPLLTHDYTLFTPYGGYYLIPQRENMERYLTSVYPATTSQDVMAAAAPSYDLGAATYMQQAAERAAGLCRLTRGLLLTGSCGDTPNYRELRGEGYFEAFVSQYQRDVVPNINNYLDRFMVRYIVRDMSRDAVLDPASIKATQVYDDGRFVIYER